MTVRSAVAGLVLVLAAVTIAAHLRFVDPFEVVDLKPRVDALEYEEAFRSLVRGDGYWLTIGASRYPPRYPPGFSLLAAAMEPLFGVERGAAVRTVFLCALLTVLVAAGLAYQLGGALPAGVAALLVAISPLHVVFSKHVMSGVPSGLLVVLVAAWLVHDLRHGLAPASTLALAVLVGLSVSVRTSNVALLPAVLMTELYFSGRIGETAGAKPERNSRVTRGLALAMGVGCGIAPILLYNGSRFGAPWRTGYEVWHGAGWRLAYSLRSPFRGGSSNLGYYAEALTGFGDLYAWPVSLCIVLGGWALWRRRSQGRPFVVFVAAFVAATGAIYVPFFWQNVRFLLPALPLLLVLAAQSVGESVPRAARTVAWACIVATAVVAWSSPGRYELSSDAQTETAYLRSIAEVIEPDAVLVMRSSVFLFEGIVRNEGTDRLWVPVRRDRHLRRIERYGISSANGAPLPSWLLLDVVEGPRLDGEEIMARLAQVTRMGRPVYFATSPRDFEVSYAAELRRAIQARFELQSALRHRDWELFRLVERPG